MCEGLRANMSTVDMGVIAQEEEVNLCLYKIRSEIFSDYKFLVHAFDISFPASSLNIHQSSNNSFSQTILSIPYSSYSENFPTTFPTSPDYTITIQQLKVPYSTTILHATAITDLIYNEETGEIILTLMPIYVSYNI